MMSVLLSEIQNEMNIEIPTKWPSLINRTFEKMPTSNFFERKILGIATIYSDFAKLLCYKLSKASLEGLKIVDFQKIYQI